MAAFAPPSPSTHPTEHLTGAVERVTFHSEETGFCVLRIKVRGHRDLVTVVGSAATITPGEYIEGQGVWVNDRMHGLHASAHMRLCWLSHSSVISTVIRVRFTGARSRSF